MNEGSTRCGHTTGTLGSSPPWPRHSACWGGVLPSTAHAQKASALAEADLIRDTWPGVIVHFPFEEPWGGAELVCGEPMTTRATAREALDDWLFEHGSVFGLGTLGFEVTHVTEWQETRTFMRFTQNIEGLDAPESYGRALAHKNAGGDWSLSYVRCAALNVPQGGLPERLVGALQAKAIAATQSKAALEGLITDWTEPELILASGGYDVEPTDPREARQVWELLGRDPFGRVSPVRVQVDAVTGEIVREREQSFNFADDVSGTVSGLVLSGEIPYEAAVICLDFSVSSDTATAGIPKMLVELADSPSGAAVASTYTDDDGDYAFTGVTLMQDSVVRFVPVQEYFTLGSFTGTAAETVMFTAASSHEVEPDGSGIADFTYINNGGSGDEYRIADMTAWSVVESTRKFYKVDNTYIPGIDDDDLLVAPNSTYTFLSSAAFYPADHFGNIQDPMIGFDPEESGQPNWAMPTIVAHEYGHFALYDGFGVEQRGGLHEGYAEVCSLLHIKPNNDITGYGTGGCLSSTEVRHGQDWVQLAAGWDAGRNCSDNRYMRAEQLVIAWREIRDLIADPNDPDVARELFVSWSFLVTPEPLPGYCDETMQGDEDDDLSARDATVYELLVADDDDASLNNGTPHETEICDSFDVVSLPSSTSPHCDDSVRSDRCRVDFDRDGIFTAFDFILLETWAQRGDLRADVNGDRQIDLFDRLEVIELGMRCR